MLRGKMRRMMQELEELSRRDLPELFGVPLFLPIPLLAVAHRESKS
jgi:hypothetical protein